MAACTDTSESRRNLVTNDKGRISRQRAGNGYPLALPTREFTREPFAQAVGKPDTLHENPRFRLRLRPGYAS